jgi:hydroxymethylglutaryl-CoA reductase
MLKENASELFKGFSKLSRDERLQRLQKMGAITSQDLEFFRGNKSLKPELAENFIENVIGFFHLPLGVAMNFRIDGVDCVIPMAVEETSIVAAASKTAKWIHESGGEISTEVIGFQIIGQIQVHQVKNFSLFEQRISANKKNLLDFANRDVAAGLVARGGGVQDLVIREIDRGDGHSMAIVHVYADSCDAMGANIINQVCEYLRHPIEALTGETVTMCILSNLVDSKVTRAIVTLPLADSELGKRIEDASLFAELDPYRAATNNKGVLNGIDPILIATGNDWRAVEAGIHAYAARSGQYRSITKWTYNEGLLTGVFEAPIIVGTVGGVTRLHPTAQMCLNMLGVKSANDLSKICAAAGLVQNLGAIRALTTVGIIEGHMKLHIANLTLGAGARDKEIPIVQKRLEEILALRKRISLSNAIEILRELRKEKAGTVHG